MTQEYAETIERLEAIARGIGSVAVDCFGPEEDDAATIREGIAAITDLTSRLAVAEQTLTTARREAAEETRGACAKKADNESEPAIGEMPAEIIERVLAQDTIYVERALIAAVRATKKSIRDAIRTLPLDAILNKEE